MAEKCLHQHLIDRETKRTEKKKNTNQAHKLDDGGDGDDDDDDDDGDDDDESPLGADGKTRSMKPLVIWRMIYIEKLARRSYSQYRLIIWGKTTIESKTMQPLYAHHPPFRAFNEAAL